MTNSIAKQILKRIYSKKRGWVFSAKDFLDIGTRSNVDFILHSLVQKQIIRRIHRGIYDFPIRHIKLGMLSPNTDNILHAIAMKTGEVIQPSGAEAANLLGLSTQVPAHPPYLTSGRSREIRIGKSLIRLKHTSIKPLRGKPDRVSLILQALVYIGKNDIDEAVMEKCAQHLSSKQKNDLRHMASQVPGWLTSIIHKVAI